MASWIKKYQDANAELALKIQGYSKQHRVIATGQYQGAAHQAQAIKLPHGSTQPLQCMTLGADYFKSYFIVGYSKVDGDDLILP